MNSVIIGVSVGWWGGGVSRADDYRNFDGDRNNYGFPSAHMNYRTPSRKYVVWEKSLISKADPTSPRPFPAPSSMSHTFKCADNSGDILTITFSCGSTSSGRIVFSNISGVAKFTNRDGEELEFAKAEGTFTTVKGEAKTLLISWKPSGKKPDKHFVKIEYGAEGEDGSYKPRVEVGGDDEEEE